MHFLKTILCANLHLNINPIPNTRSNPSPPQTTLHPCQFQFDAWQPWINAFLEILWEHYEWALHIAFPHTYLGQHSILMPLEMQLVKRNKNGQPNKYIVKYSIRKCCLCASEKNICIKQCNFDKVPVLWTNIVAHLIHTPNEMCLLQCFETHT